MRYVIELRLVAEGSTGLIRRGTSTLLFDTETDANKFGKEFVGGHRYVASWRVISEEVAKSLGHEIF